MTPPEQPAATSSAPQEQTNSQETATPQPAVAQPAEAQPAATPPPTPEMTPPPAAMQPLTPLPAPTPVEKTHPGLFAPVPPPSNAYDAATQTALQHASQTNAAAGQMYAPEIPSSTMPPNSNYAGKKLGLEPIEAPPLPISEAKQAQLQSLLIQYKANVITPEQYQTARAKILADP
jgi:hypothetical protein